jgi:hypothetical protein
MNNSNAFLTESAPKSAAHLLDDIRAIRAEVGSGLNEDELTRLLQQTRLPAESGFAFLSYCDRFVALCVPPQDLAKWYPAEGWISPAKEKIARAIADKYRLSLCEPPDTAYPCMGLPNTHHHLELGNEKETVIIAHPRFLKIRLFVATSLTRDAQLAQKPLQLGPALLEDLSDLYKP